MENQRQQIPEVWQLPKRVLSAKFLSWFLLEDQNCVYMYNEYRYAGMVVEGMTT